MKKTELLTLAIFLILPTICMAQVSEKELDFLSERFVETISKRKELKKYKVEIFFEREREQINAHYSYHKQEIGLSFWQGFLTSQYLTSGAFLITACHELGHVIGGAPKEDSIWRPHHTLEGQADYFSTLKCTRWLQEDKDLKEAFTMSRDPVIIGHCLKSFSSDDEKFETCLRSAQAGLDFVYLFEMANTESIHASFSTPSEITSGGTYGIHPAFQCRLDIFLAGAVCDSPADNELSQKDPFAGACKTGLGKRPKCWFRN